MTTRDTPRQTGPQHIRAAEDLLRNAFPMTPMAAEAQAARIAAAQVHALLALAAALTEQGQATRDPASAYTDEGTR